MGLLLPVKGSPIRPTIGARSFPFEAPRGKWQTVIVTERLTRRRAHYDWRRTTGECHTAAQRNLFNRRLLGCLHHCRVTRQTYNEDAAFPTSPAATEKAARQLDRVGCLHRIRPVSTATAASSAFQGG